MLCASIGRVTQEIRAKGSTFLSIVSALEPARNLEYRDRVLAELPGECGELLRSGSLIASGWYPVSWYTTLLGTAVREADASVVRELGILSTRASVSTVHRIFMRMVSPHTMIKQGYRVFSSYFEGAKAEVLNVAKGTERVTWLDCHGFDRNVWREQQASMEELVRLSGAKLVRSRVMAGGGDLDSQMSVEITWR